MAESADDHDIGVVRIDDNGTNVAGLLEPDVHPRRTCVSRFVHAVTERLLAGSDVNNVGIGGRESHGTDGRDMLIIEGGIPNAAAIGRLPYSASRCAHVIDCGISGNPGDGRDTASAVGTKQTPTHRGVQAWVDALRILLRGRRHARELGNDDEYERYQTASSGHTDLQ